MCAKPSLKQEDALILSHKEIARGIFQMDMQTDIASQAKAGQFIHIQIAGFMLRRPIAICSVEGDHALRIIYKAVGEGTKKLSTLKKGDSLNIFGPLGNGFPIHDDQKEILIIGGGVGMPPLYEVAKQYRKRQADVTVAMSFRDYRDAILVEEFKALGCRVCVATKDGHFGITGNCFDALPDDVSLSALVYACGPPGMLQAIEKGPRRGYVSYEARMACGMGVCLACSAKDQKEAQVYHRICKEGPVFPIGKVICP